MLAAFHHHDIKAEGEALRRLGLFDWMFFLVITAVLVAGPLLRLAGPSGLGAVILLATLYGIVFSRLIALDCFLLFTGVGLVYVVLSYFEIFPDSWTVYFAPEVIPVQAAFVFAFFPLLCAFRRFFGKALHSGQIGFCCAVLFILNATLSPLLEWTVAPDSILQMGPVALILSNLVNSELAMLLALAHLVLVGRSAPLTVASFAASAFILIVTDASMQMKIAVAMLIALHVRSWSTPIFLGALGLFTLACTVGVAFLDLGQIIVRDPNTAIRALMWIDGLEAFADSQGIGIGFGKEIVKNAFALLDKTSIYDDADIMTGGIHNSFLSMFIRLGAVGGILFALGFLRSAWPSAKPAPEREAAYYAFFLAYVSCWVNVAVESPLALIGVTMMLGYVQACRDRADRNGHVLDTGIRLAPDRPRHV